MPTVTVSNTWASATLAQDEIWQARGGTILVSNEEPDDDDDGIELVSGAVLTFKSGEIVRYRGVVPDGIDRDIRLVRKALVP